MYNQSVCLLGVDNRFSLRFFTFFISSSAPGLRIYDTCHALSSLLFYYFWESGSGFWDKQKGWGAKAQFPPFILLCFRLYMHPNTRVVHNRHTSRKRDHDLFCLVAGLGEEGVICGKQCGLVYFSYQNEEFVEYYDVDVDVNAEREHSNKPQCNLREQPFRFTESIRVSIP
jgi:hypothetical protein